MPYKILMFIQKRQELSMSEFKEGYETRHIPLLERTMFTICRKPLVYKRNYFDKDSDVFATMHGFPTNAVDFDVITEMVFEDKAHFMEMTACYQNEKFAQAIREDEDKIIDKKVFRCYVVDEASR